eukprot:TRINITY_DN441_c0_g1_i1.p1 TRINITY_DN441_c0_g1~~TRINITY_DN441_c0_g1_i1.p1  ORF type:complete len:145 (-),score=26.93 TRINITY_DN441_c0_g1_i1:69-503(-)
MFSNTSSAKPSRSEKRISKELAAADKEYVKAEKALGKGRTRYAEKHENRGMAHELRAENLASANSSRSGVLPGTGLVGAPILPGGMSAAYPSVGGYPIQQEMLGQQASFAPVGAYQQPMYQQASFAPVSTYQQTSTVFPEQRII